MIKLEKICIANLMQCTKYETHDYFTSSISIGDTPCFSDSFGFIEKDEELFEKDVYLLKIKKGGYVRLDSINTFGDYLKVNRCLTKGGFKLGGIMLSTSAWNNGDIFVDKKSLKTKAEGEVKKNYLDIKLLQKEFLPKK